MDNNNKNTDELGYAGGDTVNLKSVFGRIRKKTGEFAEAIRNSVKENEEIKIKPAAVVADPVEEEHIVIATEPETIVKKEVNEVSHEVEAIKEQSANMSENIDTVKLEAALNSVTESLDKVKKRLQAIQLSAEDGLRDNTNAVSSLKKTTAELKERIADVSQTINGVSKITDSMFDLKNAQMNMKKSIDSLEKSINTLKKKFNTSVAILSIISILVIALQIVAILS